MLRRLLTSWFVSSSTLSTTAAAHLLQGLAHVLLDCGVGHAGQSTANAIDDLKPGLPFSDHALEFVGADDADHRHAGFLDEHAELTRRVTELEATKARLLSVKAIGAEHRAALAEAWVEGCKAGWTERDGGPDAANPYRKEPPT